MLKQQWCVSSHNNKWVSAPQSSRHHFLVRDRMLACWASSAAKVWIALAFISLFFLVRLTLAPNPNRHAIREKQHSALIGFAFEKSTYVNTAALVCILFACIQTQFQARNSFTHAQHSACLKVIQINSWATAQGSAVITRAEVPAPPRLIKGKSPSVTKKRKSLYFFVLGFAKKCDYMATYLYSCTQNQQDECVVSLKLIVFNLLFLQSPWKKR